VQESDRAPTMEAVRNAVARQFGRVFSLQVLATEALSDLLPEPETIPAAAADL